MFILVLTDHPNDVMLPSSDNVAEEKEKRPVSPRTVKNASTVKTKSSVLRRLTTEFRPVSEISGKIEFHFYYLQHKLEEYGSRCGGRRVERIVQWGATAWGLKRAKSLVAWGFFAIFAAKLKSILQSQLYYYNIIILFNILFDNSIISKHILLKFWY